MRRFLPSPRRLGTIIGASAVGVVAVMALGTPAFACHPNIGHTVKCVDENNKLEITWTLYSTPAGARVSNVTKNAGDLTGLKNGDKLGSSKAPTRVIQVVDVTVSEAVIDATLTFDNGDVRQLSGREAVGTNRVPLAQYQKDCKPPTPQPSKSVTPKSQEITFAPTCNAIKVSIKNTGGSRETYLVTGADKNTKKPLATLNVKAGETKSVELYGSKLGGTVFVFRKDHKAKTEVGSSPWKQVPCEDESGSPSPAPSEVVPSESGVAGGGSLPVTGANAAIVAGVAILLVGAGSGLFLVARRRRVKFTV